MGRKLRILSMFSIPLPFLFDEDCKIMNDIGWQRSKKNYRKKMFDKTINNSKLFDKHISVTTSEEKNCSSRKMLDRRRKNTNIFGCGGGWEIFGDLRLSKIWFNIWRIFSCRHQTIARVLLREDCRKTRKNFSSSPACLSHSRQSTTLIRKKNWSINWPFVCWYLWWNSFNEEENVKNIFHFINHMSCLFILRIEMWTFIVCNKAAEKTWIISVGLKLSI